MTLDHSGALSRRIEMGVRLPFGVSGGARDPVLVRHRDGNLGRVLEISGLSAEDFLTKLRRQQVAGALGTVLKLCQLDMKLVFRPEHTGRFGNGMMLVSLCRSSRELDRGRKERVDILDERLLKLRRYLDRMAAYSRPVSTTEFLKETRKEIAPFLVQDAEPLERAGFLSVSGMATRELDRANMAQIGNSFVSTRVHNDSGQGRFCLVSEVGYSSVVVAIQSLESEADCLSLSSSSNRKGARENRLIQALARSLGQGFNNAFCATVYLQTQADSKESLSMKQKDLDNCCDYKSTQRLMNHQVSAWKASLLGSPALPPELVGIEPMPPIDLEELPLLDAASDLDAGPSPVLLGRGAFWNKEVRINPFLKGRYRSILAMPATALSPFAGASSASAVMPYTVLSLVAGSGIDGDCGGDSAVLFDPLSCAERAVVNPCDLVGEFNGNSYPSPDKGKLKFLVNLIEQILSAGRLRKSGVSSGAIENSIKRAYGRAAKEKRFPCLSELLHYLPEPLPEPLLAEFRAFFEADSGGVGRCFNGETTLSLKSMRRNTVLLPDLLRSQKRLLIEMIMIDYVSRLRTSSGLICLIPSIDNLACFEAGRDLLLKTLVNAAGGDVFWALSLDDAFGTLSRLGAPEILSSLGTVLVGPTEKYEELCEILTLTRAEQRALVGGNGILRTLGSSTVVSCVQEVGLSSSSSAKLSWVNNSSTLLKRA